MVGEKGYPLEEHLKAQKHCLLTDIFIPDRADSAFSFSAKVLLQLLKILLRLYTKTVLANMLTTVASWKPPAKLLLRHQLAAHLPS